MLRFLRLDYTGPAPRCFQFFRLVPAFESLISPYDIPNLSWLRGSVCGCRRECKKARAYAGRDVSVEVTMLYLSALGRFFHVVIEMLHTLIHNKINSGVVHARYCFDFDDLISLLYRDSNLGGLRGITEDGL